MVKKISIVALILLSLLAIALVTFVMTFDANRYKPFIIEKIESAIGNEVEIESLGLGWRNGVAFDLKGLEIYATPDRTGEPAIALKRASANLKLKPLLSKRIEIGSLVLVRPKLHLIRLPQGELKLIGVDVAAKPPEPGAVSGPRAVAAIPFLADSLELKDGFIRFTDNSIEPPASIEISKMNVLLREISLTEPIDFEADFAVLGAERAIQMKGEVNLPFRGEAGYLRGVSLDIDFEKLDFQKLTRVVPAMRTAGLSAIPSGRLSVQIEELNLDPVALPDAVVYFQVEDASVRLAQFPSEIRSIHIAGSARNKKIELKSMSAQIADGLLNVSGEVETLPAAPRLTYRAQLEHLSAHQLLPPPEPRAAQFKGVLSALIHGAAGPGPWLHTMTGEGELTVQEPVILNLNLLREVFGRLSVLPGLVETLYARLPETYRNKFDAPHTVFDPIEAKIRLQEGSMIFDQVFVRTDSFHLTGTIQVRLDGRLVGSMMLKTDPDLSQAFIRSVNELAYLTDEKGWLGIPIALEGSVQNVQVKPDIQYVARKLAVAKTQELVGGWLEKKFPAGGQV